MSGLSGGRRPAPPWVRLLRPDKSGGYRVIYYWDRPTETVYMLFVYPKNRQEDLTAEQTRILRKLVREEFK